MERDQSIIAAHRSGRTLPLATRRPTDSSVFRCEPYVAMMVGSRHDVVAPARADSSMRRSPFPFLIATIVLMMGVVVGRGAQRTVAQDSTPGALSGHPFVGAWPTDTDADDPNNGPSPIVFTSDGIYLQADADGSDGYGSCYATGERTAEVTILFHDTDEEGNPDGTEGAGHSRGCGGRSKPHCPVHPGMHRPERWLLG